MNKYLFAAFIVILTSSFVFADDLKMILDSTDGSSAVSIQDQSSQEVARINSKGYIGIGTTNPSGSFEVGSNHTLMVSAGSGRVGIGTSNPSAKLDVEVLNAPAAIIGASTNKAVGGYAVSLGNNTTANGWAAMAMGSDTSAEAYGTAMGYTTKAVGNYSTSMGYSTSAGGWASLAQGYGAKATNSESVAMGYFTSAGGAASFAMGQSNSVSGNYSAAIGYQNIATQEAGIALGRQTRADGQWATAGGYLSQAAGNASIAIGSGNTANGYASCALGSGAAAVGLYSFAAGGGSLVANGQSSFVLGEGNRADGRAAFALGSSTRADANYSIAAGQWVYATGLNSIVLGRGASAISYLTNNIADSLMIGFGNNTAAMIVKNGGASTLVGINNHGPGYMLDVNGDINTTTNVRKNGVAYNNPFTGHHRFPDSALVGEASSGDAIILDDGKISRSTRPKDARAIGIYTARVQMEYPDRKEWVHLVAGLGDSTDEDKAKGTRLAGFKVCDEGGAIKSGDLLTTSSRPGYLMKQDDNIVRSYTVGKAGGTAHFNSQGVDNELYGFIYAGG